MERAQGKFLSLCSGSRVSEKQRKKENDDKRLEIKEIGERYAERSDSFMWRSLPVYK